MAKSTAEFGATLLMAVDAFIEQRGVLNDALRTNL
jgi:hypothetical protein